MKCTLADGTECPARTAFVYVLHEGEATEKRRARCAEHRITDLDRSANWGWSEKHIPPCVGFEPHPWSIYAEEFCVAPVYVDGRPHYCGRPRSEHEAPPLHVGPSGEIAWPRGVNPALVAQGGPLYCSRPPPPEWGEPAHGIDPDGAHGAAMGMVWICRHPPQYGMDDRVRYLVSFRPLRRERYGTSLSGRAPVLYLRRLGTASMESFVGGAVNFPTPVFALGEGIHSLAANARDRRSKRWFRRLWRARARL